MLDPYLGSGGLIVVVLKDRPERSPHAVRERIRPLSRLCALPHSHESCIKQEAQPLAPGIPRARKERAR
jgi:hypothetical protein